MLVLVIGLELISGRRKDTVLACGPLPCGGRHDRDFLATTQLPLQDAIFLGTGVSLIRFCVQLQRRARLVQPTRRSDDHRETSAPPT